VVAQVNHEMKELPHLRNGRMAAAGKLMEEKKIDVMMHQGFDGGGCIRISCRMRIDWFGHDGGSTFHRAGK
jgi:hypothetical protein